MLTIVFQSTVTLIDLQDSLKTKRRKSLMFGFKSFGIGNLVGFYVL